MTVLREPYHSKYSAAAASIEAALPQMPEVIVIAGSGISDSINDNIVVSRLSYRKIKNFPGTTVSGHVGEFLLCDINGRKVGIFSGRFHLYEGREIDEICSQVITSFYLGVANIVLTNSAGGLNPTFRVGEVMMINDTINFTSKRALHLFNIEHIARQGVSKATVANDWNSDIKSSLIEAGVPYQEGVYLGVSGPTYESPAEIRAFRRFGADAIGMSTVMEAYFAASLGMNVVAFSLITNELREIRTLKLAHDHVIIAASSSKSIVYRFIEAAIKTAPRADVIISHSE